MFFRKKVKRNCHIPLKIGHEMENLACHHLQQQGLQLLLRNYRCKMGEIDFIMQDKQYIVFVEVRYRTQQGYGSSIETIDRYKQTKLIKTAEHYLMKNRLQWRWVRFDAIAMDGSLKQLKINWLKNIIEVE